MSAVPPESTSQLENFSIFHSFEKLIAKNDMAIRFLEDVNLIPSRNSTPPVCCDLPMCDIITYCVNGRSGLVFSRTMSQSAARNEEKHGAPNAAVEKESELSSFFLQTS
ncbi:hypothetical protein TKK_0014160 [Trichogramma kaykai]